MTPKRLIINLIAVAVIATAGAYVLVKFNPDFGSGKKPVTTSIDDTQAAPITITDPKEAKTVSSTEQALQSATVSAKPNFKDPAEAPKVDERGINAQSLVGLICYFKPSVGELITVRGSGVMISERGKILTARHNVDPKFGVTSQSSEADVARSKATFTYCDVGQIGKSDIVPSIDVIRASNPTIQVPVLAYRAVVDYLPPAYGLSKKESTLFDFAILRISGLNNDAPTFGVSTIPTKFPFSPLLVNELPPVPSTMLEYGFPRDLSYAKSSESTLFLSGSIATLQSIKDWTFMNLRLETGDSMAGAPIFYKGYVAGIITAYDPTDVKNATAINSNVVAEVMGSRN